MKKTIITAVTSAVILIFTGICLADGILVPVWPEREIRIRPDVPPPPSLTIKYHRVEVNIENQVARTSIDQVFYNDFDREIEGLYIFPLPEEASINEFAMFVDGKKIKGEMLDKEKARSIYEEIVRKRKDPAILEYIGKNAFRARVFPIPAKSEKRIQLEYTESLKYDAGVIKYLYPLNTEKFSAKLLDEVTLSLKIKSNVPIKTLFSPSHADKLAINKKDEYNASVSFEEKNVKPDKDFVLYYSVSKDNFGINLLSNKLLKDEYGYFMLFVAPPSTKNINAIPKDMIFVFDVSGSMANEKIEQAKKALKFCISSLNGKDRFNIINFNTDVNSLSSGLVAYDNKSKEDAMAYINNLNAIGGTDINSALVTAVSQFAKNGRRSKTIVFVTDGLPTAGETDPKNILKNIKEANVNSVRIFAFGVGYDVNTHLLDKISESNKGVSEYIKPGEDMEIKISSFYSKISNPVLSGLNLDFGSIRVKDIYPKILPDLFEGTQLIICGKYKNSGSSIVKITGTSSNGEVKIINDTSFPDENKQNDFLPRLWATRRVGNLLDEIRLNGENKELVDEIKELGKKFGIMTPYTSFLVLESQEDYKRWGINVPSAGEAAGGVKFEAEAKKALKAESGFNAIQGATSIRDLKEEAFSDKSRISGSKIKTIADKTFYLENGFWTDSEYKTGASVITIKYLSDDYFELASEKYGIGKYLAAGEKAIICFESKCYKIE